MRKFLLCAAAVATGIAWLSAVPPARAECLAADVIVHRTNESDVPVLTDGQCLTPTPFMVQRAYVHLSVGNTSTGVPSGLTVELWVPFP